MSSLGDLQEFLSWIISFAPLIILFMFALKWALKKAFPSLRNIFYFLLPTYIVNVVLVTSVGTDAINAHTVVPFSTIALLLCPPLTWDALFEMGLREDRLPLVIVSVMFIIFLPLWIACKTSMGMQDEENSKKIFAKKFLGAWIIVTLMGLGMPHFYSFIGWALVSVMILGMPLLFWMALGIDVIALLAYLGRRSARAKLLKDGECQMIDGEWVCPVEKQ